jgi:hypothetical protein
MKKLAILLSLVFLLGACGSKSSGSNENNVADRIIEPYEVISHEEAEELLGITLEAAKDSGSEAVGLRIAYYDAEWGYLQISITQQSAMPATQTQTPEDVFYGTKKMLVDTLEEVDGIGEEAFFEHGLHILQDGYYITIMMAKYNEDILKMENLVTQEMYLEAGRLAVENLKRLSK